MSGCVDGRWHMGIAHSSSDLPPTVVRIRPPPWSLCSLRAAYSYVAQASAAHPAGVVRANLATTVTLNANASNAAECQSLVRALHPTANGATFGNGGERWCKAVFGA